MSSELLRLLGIAAEDTRPRDRVAEVEDGLCELAGLQGDAEARFAEIEDALCEVAALVSGGGAVMAKIYARRVRKGRMTLEDVPQRWREKVREMLEANEPHATAQTIG